MTKNQDNVAQPRILLEADSYEHIETTGGGPNLKEHVTTVELQVVYWPKGKPDYTDRPYLEILDEAGTGLHYESGEEFDSVDLSTESLAESHFYNWLQFSEDFAEIANRQNEESRQAYYEDRADEIRMERFYG